MNSTIVIDTNMFISNLSLINELLGLSHNYHHTIVVPSEVMRELDGLKVRKHTGDNARKAITWLYNSLAQSKPGIRGQRNEEKLDSTLIKDDAILDCCLYFQRLGHSVVLLSNDRNLCVKSLVHHIPTVTYQKGLAAGQVASMIAHEAGVAIDLPDVDMEMEVEMEMDTSADEYADTSNTSVSPVALRVASTPTPMATPMAIDLDQLPPPRTMKYSKYRLLYTLETDVYDTLMENTQKLCIYRMHTWWTPQEYQQFVPKEPKPDPDSLGALIKEFSTFSKLLDSTLSEGFKYLAYPVRPSSRADWVKFIKFWGSVCVQLAGNDTTYRAAVAGAKHLYDDFYKPPERPQ